MSFRMYPGASDNSPTNAGCLSLLAGLVFLVWGVVSVFGEFRYRTMGRRTGGEVTYSWTQATRHGSVANCYYRFTVDGKEFTGKGGSQSPGQSVPVEYLANDPKTNRIVGSESGGSGGWLIGLGVVLVGVGLYGLSRKDDLLKS